MGTTESAIMAKTRKYLKTFRHAHAISPEQAINPFEYGIVDGMAFKRLLKREIIKQTGVNRYYLDEHRAMQLKKRSNRLVIILMLVFIIALLFVFLRNFSRLK